MDWISHFLKEFPPAAAFRSKLEYLEKENEFLKRQNKILKLQLEAAQKLEPLPSKDATHGPEHLNADVINPHAQEILLFISRTEDVTPSEIASVLSMQKALVERHLNKLMRLDLVHGFRGSCRSVLA
jgi:DNA-binding MarR family transcriptional regulator